MVYNAEPSEVAPIQTSSRRAGTFKKYLASGWTNHLFIIGQFKPIRSTVGA